MKLILSWFISLSSILKFYEKIAWLQFNNDDFSLRRVFGKEKLKYLEQGKDFFHQEGFSYGVEPLTHLNLQEFFPVYERYISTKHNSNVHDLISLYSKRIDAGESIYLGYLRKGNVLLGGGIFITKDVRGESGIVLGFRAYEKNIFNKLSIGYYLEYLYFTFGLEIGVKVFSRGSDRNGYGLFGSSVGLPIHKAQLWFTPHLSSTNFNILELDTQTIVDETIIISGLESDRSNLQIANIWTKLSPEEAYKQYSIFEKRGLILNFFYL